MIIASYSREYKTGGRGCYAAAAQEGIRVNIYESKKKLKKICLRFK